MTTSTRFVFSQKLVILASDRIRCFFVLWKLNASDDIIAPTSNFPFQGRKSRDLDVSPS
jgi:hypothetical protein